MPSLVNARTKAQWIVPFVELAHLEIHEAWIFFVVSALAGTFFMALIWNVPWRLFHCAWRVTASAAIAVSISVASLRCSLVILIRMENAFQWSCVVEGHCWMPSSMVDELLSPFWVLALSDPLGLISVPKAWAGIQQLFGKRSAYNPHWVQLITCPGVPWTFLDMCTQWPCQSAVVHHL